MVRRIKFLAVIIAGVVFASCCTACGNANQGNQGSAGTTKQTQEVQSAQVSEKASTVVMESDKDSSQRTNWPNDFVQRMEKDLNIVLETKVITSEQKELMLASGDFTVDLIKLDNGKESDVIKSGFAVALDPYLEKYGQHISLHTDRNNLVREFLSNGTGKLYFKRIQVGPENPEGPIELWDGYFVKWSLYKQLGFPAINNEDDYIKVLKDMIKLVPKTESGKKTYGMGQGTDNGLWTWTSQYEAMQGLANICGSLYYKIETKEVFDKYTSDKSAYWLSMTFFNKLYNEGLLDPDSFTMKDDDLKARMIEGIYMGSPRGLSPVVEYNLDRITKDPSTMDGFVSIIPEKGGMNSWYGASCIAGWENNSWFIPSSSKVVEKAVQVLDYFDNPDVLRDYNSGVKGKDWIINAEGKPELTKEIIALKSKGGDEWKKTGIGDIFWDIVGLSPTSKYSKDGEFLELFQGKDQKIAALTALQKDYSSHYNVDYPGQLHYNQVKQGISADRNGEPKDLVMVLGSMPADMARIQTKLDDISLSLVPKLVTAPSDKFAAEKEKAVKQLNDAGAKELYNWSEKTFKQADGKMQAAKQKYGIK